MTRGNLPGFYAALTPEQAQLFETYSQYAVQDTGGPLIQAFRPGFQPGAQLLLAGASPLSL